MSSTVNDNIAWDFEYLTCLPCKEINRNRESKSFKTLPKLLNHIKQCRNSHLIIKPSRDEIYQLVKNAISTPNSENFQKLQSLGMVH